MRCHYEVLGVERDATPDELKKAYRTMSLKWHPDKNNNSQESTERFQEISAAYSVLNDPNERAWYDRHRESILRGKDTEEGEAGDTGVEIWSFFSTSCFKGFGTDENSFYTVYSKVFHDLDEEERSAQPKNFRPAPVFGDANTKFQAFNEFYRDWFSFRTRKEMFHHDEYNPAEGPTREVRRAMEAHNKKRREKARRKYNELVQALARFAHKQDPRVREHRVEEKQRAAERAKQNQEKLIQQQAELQQRRLEHSRRLQAEGPDEIDRLIAAGAYGAVSDEDEEEGVEEGHYCPLCKRAFGNEKQMLNHERSKKHREAVAAFRAEFGDDEEEEGEGEPAEEGADAVEEQGEESGYADQGAEEGEEVTAEEGEEEATGDGEAEGTTHEPEQEEAEHGAEGEAEQPEPEEAEEKEEEEAKEEKEASEDEDEAFLALARGSGRKARYDLADSRQRAKPATRTEDSSDEDDRRPTKREKRKARSKAKGKGKGAAPATPATPPETQPKKGQRGKGNSCQICGDDFPSKNALFKHIAATGHAALKSK